MLRKIDVLCQTHKTRLQFSPIYFELEYNGYWSQGTKGPFFPAQTPAAVNWKLHIRYLYVHR